MFDALSFCSRLSDKSCSLQLEKNSKFNTFDLFSLTIYMHVVSRRFAPRTNHRKYIQVVLPSKYVICITIKALRTGP